MTGLRLHSAKLVAMISIQELCLGKRKIGNSWYWVAVEDMTDQKYDVLGDHLGGGVKWRYRQDRADNLHKCQAAYRPALHKWLPTDVTNHVPHAWLSTVVSL